MEPPQRTLDRLPERGAHQFSVRDLLTLTFVVSLALTTAILSRGSVYFGALSSTWTWMSLLLIAAMWVIGRRIGERRSLVRWSIVACIVSMGLPALGFEPDGVVEFGWQAWLQSYAFGWGYFENLVYTHNPRSYWPVSNEWPLACFIGCLANSLLILGWIAYWIARRKGMRPTIARWMTRCSFALMFGSLVPIAYSGGLSGVYPGFSLWAASAVMLALGSSDRGEGVGGRSGY